MDLDGFLTCFEIERLLSNAFAIRVGLRKNISLVFPGHLSMISMKKLSVDLISFLETLDRKPIKAARHVLGK